ncbi:hypothetical protein Tco_0687062 [Tanacetum coccineum]
MDKEIDLEKKRKELDNIVYKWVNLCKLCTCLRNHKFFMMIHTNKLLVPFYLKKAQRIKPTLYDGIVLFNKHDVISVVDEEDTLILEEESRSKMFAKQNDPMLKKKKINFSSINYFELNKLSEDFGKHFVPQMQLSAKQAFWLSLSNPKSEQLDIIQTPVEIEVPKELPKISLVKTSFQKLKNHIANFDKVVKVRTTPNAIIEGSWGFKYTKKVFKEKVIPFINSLQASFKDFENGIHSELNELKTVFNQMEAAVDQYMMNIVMHADYVLASVLHADNNCLVDANLEKHDYIDEHSENLMLNVKLAKKEHMVEKKFFDEVVLGCSRLKNRNVNLKLKLQHQKESFLINKPLNNQNAPEIPEFLKINELQARLDAKDVSIEPLTPKLLNNRDAHKDYIKHSREHADTLWEIVKHARALRPLDSDLNSACKIVQRIQEVLVYVRDTCPCLTKPSEKLVAVTSLNKNKKIRFIEPATSSSNTTKQVDSHKTQDSNKPVLPSIGMKSSTSASRSQSSDNTKNNRISRTTSSNPKNKVEDHPRSVKNKKNCVIEPMCNVNVKHTTLNANSELIFVKCNQCMFDANHDVCFFEFVNDVNVHSKSNIVKRNKKKNI